MTDANQWDCEAYGPEGTAAGALCFFSPELGDRVCETAAECSGRLVVERARVFDAIRAGADAGDPTMVMLAEEFTEPGQLLGGPAAVELVDDDEEPDRDRADELETEPFRTDHGDPLG